MFGAGEWAHYTVYLFLYMLKSALFQQGRFYDGVLEDCTGSRNVWSQLF